MRLGLGSYACAWAIGIPAYQRERPMSALGFLRFASLLDLNLVQIADNLPLEAWDKERLEEFGLIADSLEIDIEVGTRGIDPAHLERYLEIAEILHSPIVRVVIDTPRSRPSKEEVLVTLSQMAPRFEQKDVILAIENHDRFRAETFAEIVRAVESSHVAICLDTANSFGALEGPDVVLDRLASLTVSLHLKDFRIRRMDHMLGFLIEGTPAGKGRLEIPGLLRRLAVEGRNPNVILELWPPFQGDVESTVRLEQRWVQESVEHLREIMRTNSDLERKR